MTKRQMYIIILSIFLVLLVTLVFVNFLVVPKEKHEIYQGQLRFDYQAAYRYAEILATQYPFRVIGSEKSRLAAAWIRNEMENFGLETHFQDFEVVIHSKRVIGRNVYGISRGLLDEIIVVMAHYDIPTTTVQGAMDDASGVGVMLELTKVFSHEKHNRTLIFLATDGEEWGMLGARYFAEYYPDRDRIVAAISLDYIAIGNLTGIELGCIGQFGGYTDLWLRNLALNVINRQGMRALEPDPITEYIERAILISFTDQGPFLKNGIPSINLGSVGDQPEKERKIYHTPDDVMENLDLESFKNYGEVAERLIRTIDEMEAVPYGPVTYLKLSEVTYLPAGIIYFLQLFMFLPLFVTIVFLWQKHRHEMRKDAIINEVINLACIGIPLTIGLYVLYAMPKLGLMVEFELYPATPKDPVLYNPQFLPLTMVALSIFIPVYLLMKLKSFLRYKEKLQDHGITKFVGLTFLVLLMFASLFHNSFGTTIFLVLPAYLWIWIEGSAKLYRRLLNVTLVTIGGVVFLALVIVYAIRIYLTWEMAWYLIMGIAYGLFSTQGVLLSIGVFSIALRFLIKFIKTP